jgi:hypothetical protein
LSIFFLLGLFQVCLALTKKDIREAFIDTWCCCRRKHDNGVMSSTATGHTARPTAEETYEPEADDGYDVEPTATVNDATSSEVITSVRNQDIRHNVNDGDGGST